MILLRKCRKHLINLLIVLLLVFLICVPASAVVYGTPTYTHGITHNWLIRNTFGKTTSTATENSMQFLGYIHYLSGPNNGQYIEHVSSRKTNTKSHQQTIYPGWEAGASYFVYFIDDICTHQSTAWWYFDFR